jgi:8-oxo-dGTP pyrophosphatase MutT (NUDIX family)
MPTHAGAVAFRKRGDRTLYLVISSSDGRHWVLPKGHIEPGESPEAAALRELNEEAGVRGEIVERLPPQSFERAGAKVAVQYFLVRELAAAPARENRSIRWEDEPAAARLLTFDEARETLRHAAAVVHDLREDTP